MALRDHSTPDALPGTQQIVRNTGNARVQGFEGEASLKIADNVLVSGQFGYLDGKYLKLNGDLTGDLVVTAADYALKLPRLRVGPTLQFLASRHYDYAPRPVA